MTARGKHLTCCSNYSPESSGWKSRRFLLKLLLLVTRTIQQGMTLLPARNTDGCQPKSRRSVTPVKPSKMSLFNPQVEKMHPIFPPSAGRNSNHRKGAIRGNKSCSCRLNVKDRVVYNVNLGQGKRQIHRQGIVSLGCSCRGPSTMRNLSMSDYSAN